MDKSIKAKILFEVSEIDELLDKASVLISLCKNKEPDFIEISAVGSTLHSFYNGIENIFSLIGKKLNYDFSAGSQWHKELVNFVFTEKNGFSLELKPVLLEYMGFRHFFRHTYGYTIQWAKCEHLFLGIVDFWTILKSEFIKFCEIN